MSCKHMGCRFLAILRIPETEPKILGFSIRFRTDNPTCKDNSLKKFFFDFVKGKAEEEEGCDVMRTVR